MSTLRGTGPIDAKAIVPVKAAPAVSRSTGASAKSAGKPAAPSKSPSGTDRLGAYAPATQVAGATQAAAKPAATLTTKAPTLPKAGATRAEWEKYLRALAPGIKIVDGDTKWKASELEAIAREAAKLSPRDAALMRNLTIARDHAVAHADGPGGPLADDGHLADTVLNSDGTARMSFGDLTAAKKFGFAATFAHEMGHVAQGSGRYSPNRIREFAKLSQFQETDSGFALFSGINWRGHSVDFAGGVKPGRNDNFVSEYAKASPFEDYAESYRSYYDDPVTLLKKAPDKFLYLNADSGKYSATEVAKLLGKAGLDGQKIATDMVRDGWQTGDALERVLGASGLKADPAALTSTNVAVRGIFKNLLAKGPEADAFRADLGKDPVAALKRRNLWDGLSNDIKESFSEADKNSLKNLLGSAELEKIIDGAPNANVDRYVEAGSQRAASYFFSELHDAKGNGWDERFKNLSTKGIAYKQYYDDWGALHVATAKLSQAIQTGNPPDFLAKLKANPEQAIGADTWKRLNQSMRVTLKDPAFLEATVRRLKSGVAGEEAIAADVEQAIYTRGVRDMMKLLLGPDPALRNALMQGRGDIAKAITGRVDANGEKLVDRLPTSLRYLLYDDTGIRSAELRGMFNNPQLKKIMQAMNTLPTSPTAVNARKLLDNLSVTDTLGFVRSLNDLIPNAAKDYLDAPDKRSNVGEVLKPVGERTQYGSTLGNRLAESLNSGLLTFSGAGPAL